MAEYAPWYEFTTICLSFHKLMSIWVVYSLGQLRIKLQCMFAYTVALYVDIMFSFLLEECLFDDGKCLFNFIRNCQAAFQSVGRSLHPQQQHRRVPVAPYTGRQFC